MFRPLTEGLWCTTLTLTVPTLTQHHQMTITTSFPSRVFRRNPCSLPVSGGSVFLFGPARGTTPFFLGSEDGVSARSRGAVWTAFGPAATSISRTVLRTTGSQSNSCSTKSRSTSCSAGVRVLVFSVTLRRHMRPSSSLCSCWTCRGHPSLDWHERLCTGTATPSAPRGRGRPRPASPPGLDFSSFSTLLGLIQKWILTF